MDETPRTDEPDPTPADDPSVDHAPAEGRVDLPSDEPATEADADNADAKSTSDDH